MIELFNVKSISKKIINKLIKNEWMQKWISIKKKDFYIKSWKRLTTRCWKYTKMQKNEWMHCSFKCEFKKSISTNFYMKSMYLNSIYRNVNANETNNRFFMFSWIVRRIINWKKKREKKNHRKQNHFEKFFEDINEFTLCKKNNDIYIKNKFNWTI